MKNLQCINMQTKQDISHGHYFLPCSQLSLFKPSFIQNTINFWHITLEFLGTTEMS